MTRVLVPGKSSSSVQGGENINTKLQRREYLLKTSQLTQKWIQDFKKIWASEKQKMFNIETSMEGIPEASKPKKKATYFAVPYAIN